MFSHISAKFDFELTRNDYKDFVIVGLGIHEGTKTINVSRFFKEGSVLHDAYSGEKCEVKDGYVTITSDYGIVLLEIHHQ